MKTNILRHPLTLSFLCALAAVIVSTSAYGQAALVFSGGSGSKLTVTLTQSFSFTLTSAEAANQAPFFTFQNTGNYAPTSGSTGLQASGTITFKVNGGAAQTISFLGTGYASGNTTATDTFLYGTTPALAAGSTIVLSAGTLTTTNTFAAAPPANGSFNTFIGDTNGARISNSGTAVPEPSTWFVSLAGFGMLVAARFSRRARSA